jgi:hypothetical protein
MWEAEPDDIPLLSCVVTIESEAAGGDAGVAWDSATPNLTFGRGSLDAWLGRGARSAGRFLAGLVLGGGIQPAARAPHLVERARERAITKLFGSEGTGDHDILVPLSSSIPMLRRQPSQPLYGRSHFEYFTRVAHDAAGDPPHFAQALASLPLAGV